MDMSFFKKTERVITQDVVGRESAEGAMALGGILSRGGGWSKCEPGTGSEPHAWSGLGWICSQSLRSMAEVGFWVWGAVGARLQGQGVRGW